MSRILLLLSVLCIGAVLFSGCTGGGGTGPQSGENTTQGAPAGWPSPSGTNQTGSTGTPQTQQLQPPESPMCSNISDADWRNICNSVTNHSTYYCSRISDSDPADREGKMVACYEWVALATMNASICSEIETEMFGSSVRSACRGQISRLRNNYSSICANDDECQMLSAEVTGDAEKCETLDNSGSPYRALCYRKVAVVNKDPSLCEKSTWEHDFSFPKTCYGDVAVAMKDPSLCSRAGGDYSEDECQAKAGNISFCTLPEDSYGYTIHPDSCYKYGAEAQQDTSICDNIADWATMQDCYYQIGVKKPDASACYSTGDLVTECLALALPNPSLCESVTDKIYCYETSLERMFGF